MRKRKKASKRSCRYYTSSLAFVLIILPNDYSIYRLSSFLQLYIISRLTEPCIRVRRGDRLGVYFEESPGAIAYRSNELTPNAFAHARENLRKSYGLLEVVRFESLVFPYDFSAAAYVDSYLDYYDGTNPEADYVPCPPELRIPDYNISVVLSPATEPVTGAPRTTGHTGLRGPTGQMGATGPQGPPGKMGPQGPPGQMGEPGTNGTAGATGPPGEVGATGMTGPAGPDGATGPRGERGDQGPRGLPGEMGEPGVNGNAGATGPAGEVGATGITGPAGPDGATGPKGERGDQGPRGLPGEIFYANNDTEHGATGATGPRGLPGERGPPGEVYWANLTRPDSGRNEEGESVFNSASMGLGYLIWLIILTVVGIALIITAVRNKGQTKHFA